MTERDPAKEIDDGLSRDAEWTVSRDGSTRAVLVANSSIAIDADPTNEDRPFVVHDPTGLACFATVEEASVRAKLTAERLAAVPRTEPIVIGGEGRV